MGRARIDSDLGFAKYLVSLDFGQDELSAKIAALQSRVTTLDAERSTLEVSVSQAQSDVFLANAQLDSAILNYRANLESGADSGKSAVVEATRLSLAAQILLQDATSKLKRNKFEAAEAQSRADYLIGFTLTESREVWCADLTTGKAGTVATVEVPGEADTILIAPGAGSPVDADGFATARPVQESHQFYFNYALLPGWQKFSPTYRFGQITAIDRENDTCSVALESATSSAQALDINQADTLENVPIEYMYCNARAFSVFDHVLVKFTAQDWSQPRVVGFKDNPKQCPQGLGRYKSVAGGSQFIILLHEDELGDIGADLGLYQSDALFFDRDRISVEYRRDDQVAWTRMLPNGFLVPGGGPTGQGPQGTIFRGPGYTPGATLEDTIWDGELNILSLVKTYTDWDDFAAGTQLLTQEILYSEENPADPPGRFGSWIRIVPDRFTGWESHTYEIRIWLYDVSARLRRGLHIAYREDPATGEIATWGLRAIDPLFPSTNPSAGKNITEMESYEFPDSEPPDYWGIG